METDVNNKIVDELECSSKEPETGWLRGWLSWNYSNMSLLRAAEKKILSYIKMPFKGRYVNIGPIVGKEDCKIWTISLNEESKNTPLCMLHGLGSGVALWVLNFDYLAQNRPVYAIDILGFGRSSRPAFCTDPLEAERELVDSIEEWRREMKLEKFHILGHSFGGFLATSYAIRFPDRISHLILADPWGFPDKPNDLSQRYPIPLWVKMIAYLLQPLNPLWGVRAAGPMGPKLIEKVRPDLIKKYSGLTGGDDSIIADYIFHCNAQNPSGEAAFHSMMSSFGWAKYPMCNRLPSLKREVPLTLIYGSRSWVDHSPGGMIKGLRVGSYVDVQIIQGAGHHVYADKGHMFNEIVLKACALSDACTTSSPTSSTAEIITSSSSSHQIDKIRVGTTSSSSSTLSASAAADNDEKCKESSTSSKTKTIVSTDKKTLVDQ